MGSNKAVSFFDNSSELFYLEAGSLIKSYFEKQLKAFKLLREYDDAHGYWGFYFSDSKATIFIGCERAFIDYSVEINGRKMILEDFDERVLCLERTSRKNFLFLLDTIVAYLSSMQLLS